MFLGKLVIKLIVIFTSVNTCHGQVMDKNYTSYPNQGICSSKHINNITLLHTLNECSVIDGYLKIVLIDTVNDSSINDFSFPDLREVTQYMVFYRVQWLLSLQKMFPNLTVIRGQVLFHNYALVIYDMARLQNISLLSLTTIQRGYVRIDDNPQLCYSQTINWENITGKATGHHFSRNGGSECPGHNSCRGCDFYCWSAFQCQKYPRINCPSECLGGCNSNLQCYRCKNYIESGMCVNKCSKDRYLHPSSLHCMTKEMCSEMYNGIGWTWNGQCIASCPNNYKTLYVNDTKYCEYCGNMCNITCNGYTINSYSDAQNLKGCNIVNGSLQIQITHNNDEEDVMHELEESLEDIQEIAGYLKVYRTPSITSLNFLKNLTMIRGEQLLYNRYAIAINEMPNLEHLWDFRTRKNITILNGTLFFHYNAKLCMDDITQLATITNSTYNSNDVCNTSNGHAARCKREIIETNSTTLGPREVKISWVRIKQEYKHEYQMEYSIFYLEEPDINVNTYIARDTCYSKDWVFKYIPEIITDEDHVHSVVLDHLEPFTKYAYYVETAYRNSSVSSDFYIEGKSEIMYFFTDMDRPKMPVDMVAYSVSDDSLTLFWNDDEAYRGNITHYRLEMAILEDNVKLLDRRNYCVLPPERKEPDIPFKQDKVEVNTDDEPETKCICKRFSSMINERIVKVDTPYNCSNIPATGETFVHRLNCGNVYFNELEDSGDETNSTRQERDVRKPFDIQEIIDIDASSPKPPRENITYDNVFHSFSTNFPGHHKNYTVNNLRHFTKYLVTLAACKGTDGQDCGSFGLIAHRTLQRPSVDDISSFSVVVLNHTHVEVHWNEPKSPNGAILAYNLEYRLKNVEHSTILHCITRKHHEENNKRYILKVEPGTKYGIRIRSISLGMDSNYTDIFWYTAELSYNYIWLWVILGIGFFLSTTMVAGYFWRKRMRISHMGDTVNLINSPHVRWTGSDVEISFDFN